MVKQNPHLKKVSKNYLFPEIQKRKDAFLQSHPNVKIISLGIGDTTYPIVPDVTKRLTESAHSLGTQEGYSGYGPEQGDHLLRYKLSERIYNGLIDPDEIFISDGAKCDCGRLHLLFDNSVTIAVQDPTYPVYVDTSLISGISGQIHTMPCNPENQFFPDPVKADLIYICSPNNPTGSVISRKQLKYFVDFAMDHQAIIVFDAAYSAYIRDPDLPRSIFEIEGSREVAIEINSFSKLAGFTGLRLGWMVIPKELKFEDGHSVHQVWTRICSTFFNGASNLAQTAGIAVLQNPGWDQVNSVVDHYLENAQLIKETFTSLGYPCFGGDHAPYVWVDYSPKTSWEAFEDLLFNAHTIAIPGCGFGPSGEHFLRFSAFATKESTLEAMARISHQHAFH